jgi:hypothetical protein
MEKGKKHLLNPHYISGILCMITSFNTEEIYKISSIQLSFQPSSIHSFNSNYFNYLAGTVQGVGDREKIKRSYSQAVCHLIKS